MKIATSDILLSSQHSSVAQSSLQETLRAWTGPQRPDFGGSNPHPPSPQGDTVSLSEQGKAAQQADAVDQKQDGVENDPRIRLLISVVEALTGKKMKIFHLRDLRGTGQPAPPPLRDPAAGKGAPPSAGFGVEYSRHETHYEAEQTSFSARGVVKTGDGKEISFAIQLDMSREQIQQSDTSIRLGDAARQKTDPLVINFDGNAAELTAGKFSFDLNGDGTPEQISFVAPGSGFLALDKNNDGTINNGGELFGPASGNGFKDLAAFDQDGNGWIDENDPVFSQLKVWSKDVQGTDRLVSLKDAGVGAIFLGSASTEFSLRNVQNQLDGQVRASGVYLNENGSAGTIQQVDLAV